jgi:hypothetical protein
VKVVILILKHATLLRLTNLEPESALSQAELDYQAANIDLKVKQHLVAFSQQHSVKHLSRFIMATNIGLCSFASFKIISH